MILPDVKKVLETVHKKKLYPDIQTIEGIATNPEIVIDGKKVLIFCSNNYLGLAGDSRITHALIEGAKRYGMGSGGSRLISGNTDVQYQLEREIAAFKGTEDALTFATGYMANTGTIPALLTVPNLSVLGYLRNKTFLREKVAVFSDELNHASIVDGCILAKADRVIYKHCDMTDLESQLKGHSGYAKKLIVTDGVFSMDGDIAPLPEIMRLAKEYGASVMVDDAHATGVLGETGNGTVEYFQLQEKPDVIMGTFTKVYGGVGGFVAGSSELIKYLRVTARTYIFSAPIPPAIVAGLVESVAIVRDDHARRKQLWTNAHYLHRELRARGFNIMNTATQIIPIFIGDETKAVNVSRALLERGIFISCVRWPAVAHGGARLRMTVMASHSRQQIDTLIRALTEVRRKYDF